MWGKDRQGLREELSKRLQEHFDEALEYFDKTNIVCLSLQGSQNYGLDTPSSDVDTKLVVTPSLKDIVMNKPAVSTTYVRANDEHIDFKDIRLMFNTFRKQNLNFLEILFTEYFIINPLYEAEWGELRANGERIAHYNIYSAVKAMRGHALEKYNALEHPYPSRMAVFEKYQYDPKQLHHLLRIEDYLKRYIAGDSYADCLHPIPSIRDYLIEVKEGLYNINRAKEVANEAIRNIDEMTKQFTKDSDYNKNDVYVDELLDSVQERIMTKSIQRELEVRKEEKC